MKQYHKLPEHKQHRLRRVADTIRECLSDGLKKAGDPRFSGVSVTSVHLSSDFGYAKVFISLFDRAQIENALLSLNKAKGFFRSMLASKAQLRSVPRLHFVYDASIEHGHHLSELIDSITFSEDTPKV